MAASIVLLGSTFNTTSGTHTVVATPQAEDLIVIVTASSGNTSTTAPTDNNGGGGASIGYSLITNALKNTSADQLAIFIRDSFCQTNNSTTFTHAPGTSTGGGLAVYAIRGIGKAGLAAIRQSAVQANHASGSAPAPTFSSAALTTNMIISAVFNATSPAGLTAKSGYTRDVNSGYSTPTSGLNTMHINSGETGTAITWGSSSGSAFSSIAIEIDTTITAIENQIDLFTGSFPDPSKWYDNSQSGGTASVSNYAATLTAPASTPGALAEIESQYFYNLTGSSVSVRANITQVATVNAEAKLTAYNDEYGNQLQITLRNGNLVCGYFAAGSLTDLASVTYSASTMPIWRIRETSGTIYFEYSADNITWSSIGTLATSSSPIDIRHVCTSVAIYNGDSSGTAEIGVFSSFNFTHFVQLKQATGSSTSASLTLNSTPTQNNLLVAIVYSKVNSTITMSSSGWTALTSLATGAGSVQEAYRMFYKIAGASESTTVTATVGSSAWNIQVLEYTGIDTTTPLNIDNAQSSGSGTISTTFSSPTVTPSGGSGNILIVSGAGLGNTGITTSNPSINSSTTGVYQMGSSFASASMTEAVWNKVVNSFSGTYTGNITATGTINYSASGIAIFNIKSNYTTTTQTQSAISRITGITQKIQAALAKLTATTTKTITSVSKIVTNATLIVSAAGYFAFDDNTGSTVKDSVGTNNGTWQGTLGSQWGTGKINSDGVFNGTDNYVNMGNVLDQTGAFSVSFWFKSSVTGASVLQAVCKEQFASPYLGWGIGLNVATATSGDAGKVGIAAVDNNVAITRRQSTTAYNDGNWHHAVVTYDNSKTRAGIKIYVDNKEVTYQDFDSSSWTGSWSNTFNFEIGGRDTNNQLFSGQLDEVGIWSRVLDVSDIGQLYNNGSGYQPIFNITTTKNQTATARLTAVTSRIITAITRITATTKRTITAVTRITQVTQKTITAITRITKVTQKTITAITRITVTTTKTIAAATRITQVTQKTQSALSRITATTQKIITALGNIRNNTLKTIAAVARITATAIKTQPAIASLAKTATKTITAITRITILTTRTIVAISRITDIMQKTQSAISRITKVIQKTTTAIARLTATTTKTIAALANIRNNTLRTITGLARIANTYLRTQPAIASLAKTATKTITAISRITLVTARTIAAITRITAVTTKTIVAITRITLVTSKTITVISRITAKTTRTIAAIARITATTIKTQPAISRITDITQKTIAAISRITARTARTITATARLTATTLKLQTALARITIITTKAITAISRVTAVTQRTQSAITRMLSAFVATSRTITAVARITATTLRLQTALARIKVTTIKTITAISRITILSVRNITALTRITAKAIKNQPAVARITALATKTQPAIARIAKINNKLQTAISRIALITIRTITAVTRITVQAIRNQTGRSRITDITQQAMTGKSRVEVHTAWTQPARGSVAALSNRTIGSISRLVIVIAKNQTAITHLIGVGRHNQSSTAHIIIRRKLYSQKRLSSAAKDSLENIKILSEAQNGELYKISPQDYYN